MEPNEDRTHAGGAARVPRQSSTTRWMIAFAITAGLAGVAFGLSGRREAAQTALAQQASFNATVTDLQRQMQGLRDLIASQETRLRAREAALAAAQPQVQQAASEVAAAPATAPAPAPRKRPAVVQRPVPPPDDPRIGVLEKKFADHDEKLASTQRMVESTRSDLEERIGSTSKALEGSIARTSEEVAALRRRGERDYFEFDLLKSKAISRVGPAGVALRKVDTKRKRYTLDLLVDDNRLEKRDVNLLEPIYITSPEWSLPMEVVVNQIDKDRVRGYVSTPKFKRNDLASSDPGRAKLEPKPGGPAPRE